MFGTSGIRGVVGEEVTAELGLALGRAVATDGAERVVVGRDARLTGDVLADAVTTGLRECGADVVDVGVAATPTIARAVGWQDADAGVSVTASHNPAEDNGYKLWTPSGQAYSEAARERITEIIQEEAFALADWDGFGDRVRWDGATERHVEALVDAVSLAEPLSVVVDVGNGAGGVTARALDELGCHVETLNGQPDGRFPARPSEPTAENCASLCATVAATDADLGVAHDGDADRMMAVAEDGTFVGGDELLALFGRMAAGDGDRVAAPLNTSMAVDSTLEAVGATLTRTRVGDVFVAERASESDVVFGGEPSGAWIWPAQTRCPDGPLAACRLAELVSTRGALSSLLADVDSFPIARDSVDVPNDRKAAVMEQVAAAVEGNYEDVTTIDGVRVGLADGWFLIRPSGTQPLVRVTAQAETDDRTRELRETASALLAESIEKS